MGELFTPSAAYNSSFGQVSPDSWMAMGSMPSMNFNPSFGDITGMNANFNPNIAMPTTTMTGTEAVDPTQMFSRLAPNMSFANPQIGGMNQSYWGNTGFDNSGAILKTSMADVGGSLANPSMNNQMFNPLASQNGSNQFTVNHQFSSGPMTGKDYAQLGFQGLGAYSQLKNVNLAEKAYDTEKSRNQEYDRMYKEDRQEAIDKANRLKALKF